MLNACAALCWVPEPENGHLAFKMWDIFGAISTLSTLISTIMTLGGTPTIPAAAVRAAAIIITGFHKAVTGLL